MPLWPKKNTRPNIDAYGRSLLWHAAANGEVSEIEQQFNAGANHSEGDDAGFTPLHIAAQNGQLEAVNLLVRLGASANATDKYGNGPLWTATHYACLGIATERNRAVVLALLLAGANPHHQNNHGRSPYEISERSAQVREVYLSAGVSGV